MERKTRERMFDRLIGLSGLVEAYLNGCREAWEFAEYFGVPEDFLAAAVSNYRERYGTLTTASTENGLFALSFEPTLRVRRLQRAARGKRKMEVAI